MSSSEVNGRSFLIPIEEIKRATDSFSETNTIQDSENLSIYRGQLSESWGNRAVRIKVLKDAERKAELSEAFKIETIFHHENIIPFIGYCYAGNVLFKVQEYAINRGLDHNLRQENRRRKLTWAQRLKICITAARGLKHLHFGVPEHGTVIHRRFSSRYILLDDNLEAKITGFGPSLLIPGSQRHPKVSQHLLRSLELNLDPIYVDSGILNIESDVYSYGLVLFEVLSGMLASQKRKIGEFEEELISFVRRFDDDGRNNLIDPYITDQIDRQSFHKFTEIAYKCISFNIKDRPAMDGIIKTIEEALQIHVVVSTIQKRRLQPLEKFLITMEEIEKATENFSPKNKIIHGVYRGELSDRWENRTAKIKRIFSDLMFKNELQIFPRLNHENIVPFIGYNDNGKNMYIVSEYFVNGILYDYLKDPSKSRCITWEQRLKICIGAGRGLRYLHLGVGDDRSVIHGNFNSAKILLDEKLEARIHSFGRSILVPRNRHTGTFIDKITVYSHHQDPLYKETSILKSESDVYSFGVMLFEILSGKLAEERSIGDGEPQYLMNLVRRFNDQRLDMLVDPNIRDQVDPRSLNTFTEIAYKCISYNTKQRPSMSRIVKRIEEALYIQNHGAASTITQKDQKLEDLNIRLNEITLAIGVKGPETCVGKGGFGVVYRGTLSEHRQNRIVAIKYLYPLGDQGELNFHNELKMIFNFNHENIIPFIGYCDEGNEMIIVYEYAVNGSLDDYLEKEENRRCLTWAQRLKICLGAARGLDYLHSGLGENNSVIHRDIKSGNILLDDNLEAKLCDFGLSKSNTTDQPHTQVYTYAAGTNFYIDPIYHESGILRKESDVYSFGVVMFELLSGMLAYNQRSLGDDKPQPLLNLVRRFYDYKPEMLIDPFIKDEINNQSFNTFKDIAIQSISFNSKERPTMEMIIDRIEEALDFQVIKENSSKDGS